VFDVVVATRIGPRAASEQTLKQLLTAAFKYEGIGISFCLLENLSLTRPLKTQLTSYNT
jgi:hypothetical protein